MAVVKTKIAAVSYLNTVPFVYGITHADKLDAELLLAPPAQCARNYMDRKADIALVPVGSLPMLEDAEIITNYCIGAEKSVRIPERQFGSWLQMPTPRRSSRCCARSTVPAGSGKR